MTVKGRYESSKHDRMEETCALTSWDLPQASLMDYEFVFVDLDLYLTLRNVEYHMHSPRILRTFVAIFVEGNIAPAEK